MCLAERRRRRLTTTGWSVAAGPVVLIAVAVERVLRLSGTQGRGQSRLYIGHDSKANHGMLEAKVGSTAEVKSLSRRSKTGSRRAAFMESDAHARRHGTLQTIRSPLFPLFAMMSEPRPPWPRLLGGLRISSSSPVITATTRRAASWQPKAPRPKLRGRSAHRQHGRGAKVHITSCSRTLAWQSGRHRSRHKFTDLSRAARA